VLHLSTQQKIKLFWFPGSRLGTRGSGIGNELMGVAVGWVVYRAHRAFFGLTRLDSRSYPQGGGSDISKLLLISDNSRQKF